MSNVSGPGSGLPPGFPDMFPGVTGKPSYGKKGQSLQQWIEGYLGPEGWKKFQATLCSMINSQIQQEQSKAHAAAEKMKQAETTGEIEAT
ncbi:MAG: hypothetical protein HY860_06185 [Chlamydiales bacterium]|nr:hypothetical protein [Chlamydiales bacterium]